LEKESIRKDKYILLSGNNPNQKKYSYDVIPPSTGGQAGIYAVVASPCQNNLHDI
jgi:hypothetical protein